MPEEQEVETKELQDTLQELHEERREREAEEARFAWLRYVALTTACLAVFAAIGALQSGSLVNEAMIAQLRASDTWAEYQAARQKEHLYTLQANALIDAGASVQDVTRSAAAIPHGTHQAAWSRKSPGQRLGQYIDQIEHESTKETALSKEARRLEEESRHSMHTHHRFAYAVAMIQVAIALAAVAALTRIKPVWLLSTLIGVGGIAYFALGLAGR